MRRKILFFLFVLFFSMASLFAKNEAVGIELGNEGGAAYEKSSFALAIDFSDEIHPNFKFKSQLKNFAGIQFTNLSTDFNLRTVYYPLEREKILLGAGMLYHGMFMYDKAYENDILFLTSFAFSNNKHFSFYTDIAVGGKKTFFYHLNKEHNSAGQFFIGLKFALQEKIGQYILLEECLETFEKYRFSVPFNYTFYLKADCVYFKHFDIFTTLQLRYTDMHAVTSYIDYLAARVGVKYVGNL